MLVQLDTDCDLTERAIQFDVDAEETACAVLDELAASLGVRDAGAPDPGT